MDVYLFGKYVDDVNLATVVIPRGYSWLDTPEGRKLTCTLEREERDSKEETSDSERTLDLVREEANKIIPGLQFTIDCQEKNPDNKCPMLDLKVWKEVGQDGITTIHHTFYEKEVTAPLVFHAKGAHPWRSKLVTLGEKVRRRLRNTDSSHTQSQVLAILRTFSQKLIDGGYDATARQEILKSGIRKSYRELAQARKEGRSLYRSRKEMNQTKEVKSLINKQWFRKSRGGSRPN